MKQCRGKPYILEDSECLSQKLRSLNMLEFAQFAVKENICKTEL